MFAGAFADFFEDDIANLLGDVLADFFADVSFMAALVVARLTGVMCGRSHLPHRIGSGPSTNRSY